MKKFTQFESSIITACLNAGLSHDMSDIQAAIEAGKNPIFTPEYIQSVYADLIKKVEDMTKKK
jgi:hypothetical protein